MGRQLSELVLDLRRAPQHKDIFQTIAWVEWVVSSRFVHACASIRPTGVDVRPVFEFQNPTRQSRTWRQLVVKGRSGRLSRETQVGRDPFSPFKIDWRCPLGHSEVGQFLSEIYLNRSEWDGSDISVTDSLFGQGRNLLRPSPLIIITQRAYRAFEKASIKGASFEPVHLV
jgi:hypothetical protein